MRRRHCGIGGGEGEGRDRRFDKRMKISIEKRDIFK